MKNYNVANEYFQMKLRSVKSIVGNDVPPFKNVKDDNENKLQ